MVEGLLSKQEKPSNTEVLGELIDQKNINFISNLVSRNVKGLFKINYFIERLKDPNKDAVEILENNINKVLEYKTSVPKGKSGNRTDQIVDALKGIGKEEEKDELKSVVQDIKGK